jgi:hypothetical protein
LGKRLLILLSLLVLTVTGCITIVQPTAQSTTPPSVVTFTATPTAIKSGESSTLLWNVTGATSVTIDGGIGPIAVAGSKTVSPAATTDYTLTATNSAGTTVQKVTVTINEPNIIKPGRYIDPIKIGPLTPKQTILDFVDGAPNAKWQNFMMYDIPFKGEESEYTGCATYRYNVTLEDGNKYDRVLLTLPKHAELGDMKGTYGTFNIPSGSRFVAKVGFMDGASGTNGVEYSFGFKESGADKAVTLVKQLVQYEGKLHNIDVSLDSIAGKTGQPWISIMAAGGWNKDWATWVEAKIVK